MGRRVFRHTVELVAVTEKPATTMNGDDHRPGGAARTPTRRDVHIRRLRPPARRRVRQRPHINLPTTAGGGLTTRWWLLGANYGEEDQRHHEAAHSGDGHQCFPHQPAPFAAMSTSQRPSRNSTCRVSRTCSTTGVPPSGVFTRFAVTIT